MNHPSPPSDVASCFNDERQEHGLVGNVPARFKYSVYQMIIPRACALLIILLAPLALIG